MLSYIRSGTWVNSNLEQLLASEVIVILFWNLDQTEVPAANDAYLRLLGYSREDLQAGRLDWRALARPPFTSPTSSPLPNCCASARTDRTKRS